MNPLSDELALRFGLEPPASAVYNTGNQVEEPPVKIYTLKCGKQIAFAPTPRPAWGDVVFFTPEEWAYVQAQKYPQSYKLHLWNAKKADCNYQVVPPEHGKTQRQLAQEYSARIREMLQSSGVKKAPDGAA